jgi:hypothetical protein
VTAEQLKLLRRFAAEEAGRSRHGRRWRALLRRDGRRFLRTYAASPVLRRRTERALEVAAALVGSRHDLRPRVIDDELLNALADVLEAIPRHAGAQVRGVVEEIRRDLHAARGKTVAELLDDSPRQER